MASGGLTVTGKSVSPAWRIGNANSALIAGLPEPLPPSINGHNPTCGVAR